MTVQGGRNPYLPNDLSDRIYAAYHALKEISVKKERQHIADALERNHVDSSRAHKRERQGWVYEDVNDRVKQYERQQRKRIQEEVGDKKLRDDRMRSWRNNLVNRWIADYRWHRKVKKDAKIEDFFPQP